MTEEHQTSQSDLDADDEVIKGILLDVQNALSHDEEDIDQVSLVNALQQHRTLLLNYATKAYINKPNNPKLLEAVTSLVAQLEKAVRDNRKERERKKDRDDNRATFNQLVDAMKNISSGKIDVPTFNMQNFILDPSKSLFEINPGMVPIGDQELEQGNKIVDMSGEAI